jgi:hypothetical protein
VDLLGPVYVCLRIYVHIYACSTPKYARIHASIYVSMLVYVCMSTCRSTNAYLCISVPFRKKTNKGRKKDEK